jgi:hypothetical protein
MKSVQKLCAAKIKIKKSLRIIKPASIKVPERLGSSL